MKNSDKPTCGDHGGFSKTTGKPCERVEGWGTDFESGMCKRHRGTSPDGESHENNGHAEKHALTADPKKYKERQSKEDEDWIRSFRESILDNYRTADNEPGFRSKVLAELIAINAHITFKAAGYIDDTGLVQEVFDEDGGYTKEIPNSILSEFRQHNKGIFQMLEKLDRLNDTETDAEAAAKGLIKVLSEEAN